MIFLTTFLILISGGFILFYRRNDLYDKIATALFMVIFFFMSFGLGMFVNIPRSYLSANDISIMVHDCQKDLQPYQKCMITVSKPEEK